MTRTILTRLLSFFAAVALHGCGYPEPADVTENGDTRVRCPNGVSDCPTSAEASCGTAACTDGYCELSLETDGTALPSELQEAGDCSTWVCDGLGGKRRQSATDPQDDSEDCTADVCVDGVTMHQPLNGMVTCYSGADGTLGVGECKSGMQQCSGGVATGACIGEVRPQTENCEAGLRDEDCDGMVNEDGAACLCQPGVMSPCYEGPADTADVGVCETGMHECLPTGLGYAACTGQVLPGSAEVCDGGVSLLDENCSGMTDEGCVCAPNVMSACPYSGPAGTNGVGVCRAATHTCNATGTAYVAACAGEVLPSFDWCSTTADENCSGASPACTGTWATAMGARFTSIPQTNKQQLAVASDGTSVAVVGETGMYIVRMNAVGTVLWTRDVSTAPYYMQPIAVAFDPNFNVLVTGAVSSPVNFGGGVLTPTPGTGAYAYNTDIFIAKFDANGNFLWAKVLDSGVADNGNYFSYGRGIATDAAGNVIVSGQVGGAAMNFGGGGLGNASTCDDAFLVKYSASGAHVWSRRYSSTACNRDWFGGVGVDSAGNIYTTLESSYDFAVGSLALGHLYKFDSNGTPVWSAYGCGSGACPMAVSPSGNVWVADPLGGNVHVSVVNNAGQPVWSYSSTGGSSTNRATLRSIALAPNSSAVVLANMGQINLGQGMPTGATPTVGVVVLDAQGQSVFAEYGMSTGEGLGVGIDQQGDLTLLVDGPSTASIAGRVFPAGTGSRPVAVRLDR